MRLVERHIVKDNRFEDICLKSGLLYNYVLYNIRQEIFSGNYLKEFDLSNKLCIVSYFDKGLRRRDVVDVPCYMNVLAK